MTSQLRIKVSPLIMGLVVILLLACPVFAFADPPPPTGDSMGRTTIEVVSKKSGAAADKDAARAVLQKIAPPAAQRSPEESVAFDDVCLDRFQSCTNFLIKVNQYRRLQDPVPIGTWLVNVDLVQITMWSSHTTLLGSNATVVGFTGAAKPGAVSLEFHGTNGVLDAGNPESEDTPDIIGTHTFTASMAMLDAPQSDQFDWFPGIADVWDEQTSVQFIGTANFPGYFPDAPQVILSDNWVRCDDSATGAYVGCVNPFNQAKLVTMKQLPNVIANIRDQVANGAPTTLTRLQYDLAHIAANREAVCPASRPRPAGKSCDEYPFARSYEGGYANGVGGWAWVPTSQENTKGENDAQGGFISSFYQNQRVMDGEPYEVDISN